MLKIDMTLAHPICNCKKQNVAWAIGHDTFNGLPYHGHIIFQCQTCQTSITFRNNSACIRFEKGYPEGQVNNKNVLSLVKGEECHD